MVTPLITITAIIIVLVACVFALVATQTYRRYRQRKVVICPDNQNFAEVTLEAGRAAIKSLFGKPELKVKSCSRWPHQKGCGEGCVTENWPNP